MQAQGDFALSWQANGLYYGIPKQIDEWLAQGLDVLVNGSRAHLPQARQRYPQLLAILLTVSDDTLRQRLLARGRESLADIEERLQRNSRFTVELLASDPTVFVLDNSGALQQTADKLLQRIAREHACA
jgi:ribose 1,5-bisphosphokinase